MPPSSDRLTLRQSLQAVALGAIVGAMRGVFDVVRSDHQGWDGAMRFGAWMIGGRAINGAIGTVLGITIGDWLTRHRPNRRSWGMFLGMVNGFTSSQLVEPRYASGEAISGLMFTLIAAAVGGIGGVLMAHLFPEGEEPSAKAG